MDCRDEPQTVGGRKMGCGVVGEENEWPWTRTTSARNTLPTTVKLEVSVAGTSGSEIMHAKYVHARGLAFAWSPERSSFQVSRRSTKYTSSSQAFERCLPGADQTSAYMADIPRLLWNTRRRRPHTSKCNSYGPNSGLAATTYYQSRSRKWSSRSPWYKLIYELYELPPRI